MASTLVTAVCSIPPNSDIIGIGVRIAIYVQNIFCFILALWNLLDDGRVSDEELEYSETQTTTNIVLAFAILISSVVQGLTLGMTSYHGNIVLMMSWMNNTNAFVYLVLYIHHKTGLSREKGPVEAKWSAWVQHIRNQVMPKAFRCNPKTSSDQQGDDNSISIEAAEISTGQQGINDDAIVDNGATTWGANQQRNDDDAESSRRRRVSVLFKRFALVLGSLHLTAMAAFGVWLWVDLRSFGLGKRQEDLYKGANECAVETGFIAILGHYVPFNSSALRTFSLAFYSLFLIPAVNLAVPAVILLGVYLLCHSLSLKLAAPSARQTITLKFIVELSIRRLTLLGPHFITLHIPTFARILDASPPYACIVILLVVNVMFMVDIELTLDRNLKNGMQSSDEWEWGFGQILAILLLLLPARDLVEALLERRHRQRRQELYQELVDALDRDSYQDVKKALKKGSAFPSPLKAAGHHLKLWSLVVAHDAIDYFDDLRRSRMTAADMALEGNLYRALQKKNTNRYEISMIYEEGADLIASALHSAEIAQAVLRVAAFFGWTEIVQFHAHRRSRHFQKEELDKKAGFTPNSGHPPEYPNEYFADVNSADELGNSALTNASGSNYSGATVQALLARGDIKVNHANCYGRTTLMQASEWGEEDLVTALLVRGDIQVNLVDRGGDTALMRALDRGGVTEPFVVLTSEQEWTDRAIMLWAALEQGDALGRVSEWRMEAMARAFEPGDIQVNCDDRNTTVMKALYTRKKGVAELLLMRPEIDLSIVNKSGKTAYMIALENDLGDVAERIRVQEQTSGRPIGQSENDQSVELDPV